MKNNMLLRVNLSTEEIKKENIPQKYLDKYLGGSGLATKYLYDEVEAQTDAFSQENKIIFAIGPFQGFPVPGGAKWAVVSRSPLTNTFGISTAGAEWGVNLGKAGYRLLIIEGRANIPVYIYIHDEKIEFKTASKLWGKDAIETCELIRDKYPDVSGMSIATIGPAGERKVNIACIVADNHSFAGRCGLGAVMGDKNLKAVVVKGTGKPQYNDEEKFKEKSIPLFKKLSDRANNGYRPHGTALNLQKAEAIGDLPIKYWNSANWAEGAEKIGAPNFTEKVNAKPWPCKYCPVACHHHVNFEYKSEKIIGAGAEYETLGMLGSNCLVDNPKAISKANDLCNRLGIDTISAGAYVGFTMECFEKNLISEKDINGRKANWGNEEFMISMVEEIGKRKGFGAIFSEGIRGAINIIGEDAKELAVEVKNLDFPAHDPRSYFTLALNYATGIRGACHLRGYPHVGEGGSMLLPEVGFDKVPDRFSMEKKPWLTKLFQDLAALHDSLLICIFIPAHGMTLSDTADILNYIEGKNYEPRELMKIGERIVNLQRLINVEDGISRKDDRLPSKMFIASEKGFRAGKVPEPFETNLLKYYELRGWDKEGRPKRRTLKNLDII